MPKVVPASKSWKSVKNLKSLKLATAAIAVPLILCSCGTPPSANDPNAGGKNGGGQPSTPAAPPAEYANVPATNIASYTPVTLKNDQAKVVAEVPQIPNARNLTQAIEVVRERLLREAKWGKAESVDVKAQPIGASPDALGMAITSVSTENGAQRVRTSTIWYDPSQVQSFSSPILIEESQWGAFAKAAQDEAVKHKLDGAKVAKALADTPAPQGNGAAIGFDGQGNLVLHFGSGAITDNPIGILLPKEQANAWLSEFGKKAQASAATPQQYTAKGEPQQKKAGSTPPPTAAPTATPSATAAPDTSTRPSTAVGPDCHKVRCIALTYDDGPGPQTQKVLDTFAEAKAAATFFEMGEGIKAYPEMVKTVAASGMEIGNHTVSHQDLARVSADRLDKEVNGNSKSLQDLTGRPPLLFRPPYGSHKEAADKVIGQAGMAIIQWSADTNDWQTKSTSKTENAAIYGTSNLTAPIVLMHDIHDFTVAAAPAIVKGLQDKGVTLVTVSELTVNDGGVYPGHAYCRGTQIPQEGFLCKG